MFVASTGINCTDANYNASRSPPSPRKAGVIPVSSNWTAVPRSAMVTPRDPLHQAPGENTSSPHRTGSVQTRRRGSCSADMLESTMNEINGGCAEAHQPMDQEGMPMDYGASHAHVHTAQTHPFLAASQHQMSMAPSFQQQPFGQIPVAQQQQQQPKQQHSTLSATDLMTLSTFTKPQTLNNQHSTFGMFKSSSHHTSHTAAAGDLLSMTLDNPFTRAKEQNKRRVASYGGGSLENITSHMPMGTFGQPKPAVQTAWPQQPQQFSHTLLNQVSTGSASPAHSQQHQQLQNNEEPYQNQRNKRRCFRSDSFEMMDE